MTIIRGLAVAAALLMVAGEPATGAAPGAGDGFRATGATEAPAGSVVAQAGPQRVRPSPARPVPTLPVPHGRGSFTAIVPPPITGEGATQMAAVDKLVRDYLVANNLPGATVAVSKDRRLVWSKGYGYANFADKTPMQPWHRTFFGSVGKVITTLAAMALVEDGALDLDALVYGKAAPLWGSNPADPPGVIFEPGVLADPGAYFNAMIEAALKPPPPDVEQLPPDVETALQWSSKMTVRHLLSHTSGLRRSGSTSAAVTHFNKPAEAPFGQTPEVLTYRELHLAMLMGLSGQTLRFEPGTSTGSFKADYSNHAFGLAGALIAEQSGLPYADFVQQRILLPLGLSNVVPAYVAVGSRDAFRHRRVEGVVTPMRHKQLSAPTLGLAAGGWTASAQDLVRIMCATDPESRLPILRPATIQRMEADAVSGIQNRPLGWDSRSSTTGLRKNGMLTGGTALIAKYPPGSRSGGIDLSNINVAIGINISTSEPGGLVTEIAKVAGQAAISQHFDLFDPAFRCAKPALGLAPAPQ
jgi:CubicO group peptidase (beta-lactamase class C family)